MTEPSTAISAPIRLTDRGIVSVTGADAATFLHSLVSANVEGLADGAATYAALLSPQGKILFDFIVARDGDGYLIDVALSEAPALTKRLGFYKLRSAVAIADRSTDFAVVAAPTAAELPPGAIALPDPRHAGLGARAIVPRAVAEAIPVAGADYEALRIDLAVPAFGLDFKAGELVPHDLNFDDLNAIDFRKGCYVGQEIVSRMKHRGTARRRLVHVRSVDPSATLPAPQTEILAGARSIGTMGSSTGARGLAIIRLDWAKDAIDRDIAITAADRPLAVALPAYARFAFPETVADA
jgi:folate-binding protein YgfZ